MTLLPLAQMVILQAGQSLSITCLLLAACTKVLPPQVQLLQEIGTPREEPPVTPGRTPAKGAPAAAPPGVVDLAGLTLGPCPLVTADQAVGAQVVQLHLQSAEPLPDTLQAAAAAAGMTGFCAPASSCMLRRMTCAMCFIAQVMLHAAVVCCAATFTPALHWL